MNAIELIKQDHETVDGLFQQWEESGPDETARRRDLVRSIVRELSVHAAVEEQILYPAMKDALPDGDRLVKEALDEHQEAKEVLAELDDMEPSDRGFDARVTSLIADVRHHVEEEETEMLPKLAASLSPDLLEDMGRRMERAKSMAPTRPHPLAPSTPPGNTVAGPTAAVVDRVRDAVAGRPPEEQVRGDARTPARKRPSRKTSARKPAGRSARRRGGPVFHVTTDPRGGWRAAKQGSSRALARSDSKQEVISRARETAKRQEGRLVIHKQDGRIQEERTYGNDSARSKG